MIIELNDDEFGHSLEMGGVIHSLVITEGTSDLWPLMLIHNRENTALLDQDDIDALHAYLSRYVSVPTNRKK